MFWIDWGKMHSADLSETNDGCSDWWASICFYHRRKLCFKVKTPRVTPGAQASLSKPATQLTTVTAWAFLVDGHQPRDSQQTNYYTKDKPTTTQKTNELLLCYHVALLFFVNSLTRPSSAATWCQFPSTPTDPAVSEYPSKSPSRSLPLALSRWVWTQIPTLTQISVSCSRRRKSQLKTCRICPTFIKRVHKT